MSVESNDPVEIFPNFAYLFNQASQMNVRIDPLGLTQIFSTTVHLDALKRQLNPQQRAQALAEWHTLLVHNQGKMLPTSDFWEWFKKWFVPDPFQADRLWLVLARTREFTGQE